MKKVRMEFKRGEYCLVVNGTNRIVSRSKSEDECMLFLMNNDEYCYAPMRKDVHYVV